jgi:formate hydrogenlyase subunit 3/multisubunit Na+/H+ antiporter MnhD subunit
LAQYQISISPLNLFYVSNLYGKFVFVFDSTISHIGFMLLSLAINTEQSIDSFLFYLIQYTITNLNIFLIILAVTYSIYTQTNTINHKNNNTLRSHTKLGQQIEIRYIYELKGLFFTNPLLSLCLCISLFSMAGIPPVKNSGKILYWEKLSNPGEALKLLILNYSRKNISG